MKSRVLICIYLLLMIASAVDIAFRGFIINVLVGIGVTVMGGIAIMLAILSNIEEKIKKIQEEKLLSPHHNHENK